MSVVWCARGGARVRVVAEDTDLEVLRDAVTPYFTTAEAGTLTGTDEAGDGSPVWTVYGAPRWVPPDQALPGLFEQESRNEPPRRLRYNLDQRVLMVEQPDPHWRRMYLVRHVRNLVRRLYRSRSHVFLHGGGVRCGADGLVVVGGKRAGKTTTVLSLLAQPGAAEGVAFLGNDDVSLVPSPSGGFQVLGWPRSVGIRRDSLRAAETHSPGLMERFGLRYTEGDDDESLYVTHRRFAAALGCPLAVTAPLAGVLFPTFVDCRPGCEPRIHPVSGVQVVAWLRRDGLQSGDRFDHFLDKDLPAADPEAELAEFADTLATVPGWRLEQCMHRMPESARLVWATVGDHRTGGSA